MPDNPSRKALTLRQNDAVAIVKEQKGILATYGVQPAWFSRVLQEAFIRNPMVKFAKRKELAFAVRDACKDGLIPDGKQAALIVTDTGHVSYLPMVGGYKVMAYRAFKAHITHGHICEKDEYDFTIVVGDVPELKHKPARFGEDRGEVIAAWAMMEMPDGRKYFKLMDKKEIAAARSKSTKKTSGPWQTFPGPMAEKSCVKSLVEGNRHLLPDTDVAKAFAEALDRDSDFGEEGIEITDMVELEEGEFEPAEEDATETGETEPQVAEAEPASQTKQEEEAKPAPEETKPPAEQAPPAEEAPGERPVLGPILLTHHVKMEPFVFPAAKALGVAYQILPKVPDGLHFSVKNHTLWGSPRAVQPAKEYNLLVMVEGVEQDRLPFTIEVQENPDRKPEPEKPKPEPPAEEPKPGWLW